MATPIVYLDRSAVREGKGEALRDGMRAFAEAVEAHEPKLVAFGVHFSDDGTRMTVIHVHRDADSLDRHLDVVGPMLPTFADLIDLRGIEVYGAPSARAMDQLRQKAEALGGGAVEVHDYEAGFMRQSTA